MKYLVSLWAFLWLSSLNATPVAMPPEQLEIYKTAVSIPVSQASYACQNPTGYILPSDVQVAVDGATEGSVDAEGGQPIITFVYLFDTSKWVIRFTSTPDFQTVTSLSLEMFDQQQLNKGDIKDPSLEIGYASSGIMNCSIKK